MTKKLTSILLIDDDDADNFFHTLAIQKMDTGIQIKTAENGLDALQLLHKNDAPPDLIFLDINMPKMNGWEFLQEFKKLEPKLKTKAIIVMLTTSDNPEDVKKATQTPEVVGFETKPLTTDKLKLILENHFQS
jgi:CheY-like chemotaxis protein